MRDTLDTYFDYLESFMMNLGFKDYTFNNTSRAIQSQSEPEIEQRIIKHKDEIRDFFLQICTRASFSVEVVGEALFLIYSGATTESANRQDLKPVTAGREAALSLFDVYLIF